MLGLRPFTAWCLDHGLHLFEARRGDIESFGRHLETCGRARPRVSRRLCIVAGSTATPLRRICSTIPPAVHVRRPHLDYDAYAVGLDRNEVGALLVAGGLGGAVEHALISPPPWRPEPDQIIASEPRF